MIARLWQRRWVRIAIIGAVGIPMLVLIVLAAMPWGSFKATIESRLSARIGRHVTIGSVERLDSFSLSPTIRLRNVRVPQADWAGKGDLANISDVTVRFPVLPLLVGKFRPNSIVVSGGQLALVRDAQRRVNWSRGNSAERGDGGDTPSLEEATITKVRVTYRDAVQDRAFDLLISADRQRFRIAGRAPSADRPLQSVSALLASATAPSGSGPSNWI